MNKFTLLFLGLFFSLTSVIGQNIYNLEFFTQETSPFTLFINGIQQHASPTTNIRVEGFIQPVLKMRMEFADHSASVAKTLYMPEESSEISYQVKNTKKGIKVRFFSSIPIAQAPPIYVRPNFIIVPYATVPVITQISTTTTTIGNNSGVNVGINSDDVDINVSVNMGGNGSVYQETTTTTIIGNSGGNVYVMEGYDGSIGCDWPISTSDFAEAKRTIKSKGFDDTRMGIAKQIIQSNCMISSQVRDLVNLMSFDDTKLELAKFAYGYTYDIGNYFKVSQVLEFESSVDELNEYIANFGW
tara:strand:+ start:21121 stop:22020 length:900 start_codon:yes stop_codon:yes gene_type:complete